MYGWFSSICCLLDCFICVVTPSKSMLPLLMRKFNISSAGSSMAGGIAAVVFSCTLFRFVTLRHLLSFIRGLRVSLNCVFSFLRKKALLAIDSGRYSLLVFRSRLSPFAPVIRAVNEPSPPALFAFFLASFALFVVLDAVSLVQEERPLFLELLRIPLCRTHRLSKNCLLSVRFLTFFPL